MSKIIFALAAFALCTLAASADNSTSVTPGATATSPTKAIGPAPAHSKQSKVLAGALSPETRKTLLDAMNSVADDDAKPRASSK